MGLWPCMALRTGSVKIPKLYLGGPRKVKTLVSQTQASMSRRVILSPRVLHVTIVSENYNHVATGLDTCVNFMVCEE